MFVCARAGYLHVITYKRNRETRLQKHYEKNIGISPKSTLNTHTHTLLKLEEIL